MTGGGKKRLKKKKITGSNKFPHNGLKNKMLLKQVQQKVCVQKPYGQWECVGVLCRRCWVPTPPRTTLSITQQQTGRRQNTELGRGEYACACSRVCTRVHLCMYLCVYLRVHAPLQEAREQACTGVCRCAVRGAFPYSEAH